MEKTVEKLNELYSDVFKEVGEMAKFLGKSCVDNALDFHYGHRIKIGGQFTNELYPIPLFRCKLKGIKTEIFFDVYTSKNYIGYIKLYPSKDEILKLDLNLFKDFKYLIYGFHCEYELLNCDDIEQTKEKIKESKDTRFIIYSDFKNIKQIFSLVEKFMVKPEGRFSTTNYKCECGHYVTIESNNGCCPVCGKHGPFAKKFKTKCPVCGNKCFKDMYGNGDCDNCGWHFDKMSNRRQSRVIYPNLISLNRAKQLYADNRPFKPDFNEFLEAFDFYGETGFEYKNVTFCLYRYNDNMIEMEWGTKEDEVAYFKDKKDFIRNAKIGNEYIRDIWDKVENPCYL